MKCEGPCKRDLPPLKFEPPRKRCRDCTNAQKRERYASDQAHRERSQARVKARRGAQAGAVGP